MLITLLLAFAIIIVSMTTHEASHAYVAYWLGDHTAKAKGRLTLNPIKHLDPIMSVMLPLLLALMGGPIFGGAKPVPINPTRIKWGSLGVACVAVAGPLVNLFLAFIFFCILYYTGATSFSQFLGMGVSINLGFFIFNMIPIPPLDGSRVLYAIAPDFVQKAMGVLEQYSLMIVVILVMVFSSALSAIMISATSFILEVFQAMMI